LGSVTKVLDVVGEVLGSGPTMTWTMVPDRKTPCAPAALSAGSLTRAGW